MLRWLRSTVRTHLLSVEFWRRKNIFASFAVPPQTTKVTTTVHAKCLVKTEKELYLWVQDMNREAFQSIVIRCGEVLSSVSGIHRGSWKVFPTDKGAGGLLYSILVLIKLFRNLKKIKLIYMKFKCLLEQSTQCSLKEQN